MHCQSIILSIFPSFTTINLRINLKDKIDATKENSKFEISESWFPSWLVNFSAIFDEYREQRASFTLFSIRFHAYPISNEQFCIRTTIIAIGKLVSLSRAVTRARPGIFLDRADLPYASRLEWRKEVKGL